MFFKSLKNNQNLFLFFLGFAYCYGVLSTEHYEMLGNSYYIGMLVTVLVGIGVFFGLRVFDAKKIGISSLTWAGLAAVISIQPLFNNIAYADSLIFPFGFFVLATLLSIVAVNIPTEKHALIVKGVAWLFLIVGLLNVLTQFVQLAFPNHHNLSSFISRIPLPIERSAGNIAQPNQASFLVALSITSVFYLLYISHKKPNNQKKTIIFLMLSLFVLMIGLALTLSRTGLALLPIVFFGSMLYPWLSHKVRFGFFGLSAFVLFLGYKVGSWLAQSFLVYAGGTGVDRLMNSGLRLRKILWERAWDAFLSNPVFGVGYDNYYVHGWDNIERLEWFENAGHAHNLILQVAAEFGLVGLITLLGVACVLLAKVIAFLRKKLPTEELFLCIILVCFLAYSMVEFPLWYPFFCFAFVFFVGLLDKGIVVKQEIKKPLMALTIIFSVLASLCAGFYRYYLMDYEIVIFAQVDNQQKIDAYHRFPTLLGFTKAKEYMLHTIVDEEKTGNTDRLIQMGDRLIRINVGLDVKRMQTRLLMKHGKQEQADKLNRALCIWEYQLQVRNNIPHDGCSVATESITRIDPDDTMGYAKRLHEWYKQRYGDE